jgi:hypothetical protein
MAFVVFSLITKIKGLSTLNTGGWFIGTVTHSIVVVNITAVAAAA